MKFIGAGNIGSITAVALKSPEILQSWLPRRLVAAPKQFFILGRRVIGRLREDITRA